MIHLLQETVNWLSNPPVFVTLSIVLLGAGLYFPGFWSKTALAVAGGLTGGFFLLSLLNPNFREIVAKPDNLPITLLLFLVGFFTWVSLHQAFANDRRTAAGEPVLERQETLPKTFVWPDLVFIEFIALILCSVVLIVWSVVLKAPIEEPANPADSPPSTKAPWYFLGLQEMLVYFDPWIAGVVLPGLIIVGLMAIPYIDRDPKASGYYTFRERRPQILVFLFGFLILWVLLIVLGTFLRGPNWNFFGPYEFWDVHKLVLLNNVNLSELLWVRALGVGLPKAWILREAFGILLVLAYFLVPPVVLAKTWFREYYLKVGTNRYALMIFLLLGMLSLPIKMYLRWIFNLKYIVWIPEYFFNI